MGSLGAQHYNCRTQDGVRPTIGVAPRAHLDKKAPIDSLVVGIDEIVPRWDNTPPRTLQYWVHTRTFPTDADAQHAAAALEAAGNEWNKLSTGIAFAATTDRSSAHFYLVYEESPRGSTVLAQAFFPNEINQDVIVWSYAFELEPTGFPMKNVFMHELGHVLGLRHEFALEPPRPVGKGEPGTGAVRIFGENPKSVMAYNEPPMMQDSDKKETEAFYKLKNGTLIGTQPITDYMPQIRERIRGGR